MRWMGNVTHMGKANTYKIVARKPVERKLLGIPRCWWEDNIKMDL
jgi:hypothetical protein